LALLMGAVSLCATLPVQAGAQSVETLGASLDSLLRMRVRTASRYSQTALEAPASVTIVTADEIRRYGYRNLDELLELVPGFYISNDRNYSYLGARGFSRPTDYNNRILLLIDGHTLNDHLWGGAAIGSDTPINFDIIERIEIVRGPGSALYGTNAMFAVINIVTKTGTQLDGTKVSGELGTGWSRRGTLAAGRSIGTEGWYTLSGVISRADGGDLYFPEYGGVAHDLDWERGVGGHGALSLFGITGRIGYTSRAKGIPTGAFDAAFDDPRAKTVDETFWGELAASKELNPSTRIAARLYADRYRYRGVYPFDESSAASDGVRSVARGVDAQVVWDASSRHRFTLGGEYQDIPRAQYYEELADGDAPSDNSPYSTASAYAQAEMQLSSWLTLVGGTRYDHFSHGHESFAPRAALIGTLDSATHFKLLYGEAFRAPSVAEAHITTSFYTENHDLRPERIRTFEIEVTRRILRPVLVGVSAYEYRIKDLIDQVEISATNVLRFENVASVRTRGISLHADVLSDRALSGRLTYGVQKAEDRATGETLSNSPEHIGTMALVAQRFAGFRPSIVTRYESPRVALGGLKTSSFVRTDINLSYKAPREWASSWTRNTELSLLVRNLFDRNYYAPGGLEHRQAMIAQPGRTVYVRLGRRL
jgi:outer membrane receptor protein involved in Fe transport